MRLYPAFVSALDFIKAQFALLERSWPGNLKPACCPKIGFTAIKGVFRAMLWVNFENERGQNALCLKVMAMKKGLHKSTSIMHLQEEDCARSGMASFLKSQLEGTWCWKDGGIPFTRFHVPVDLLAHSNPLRTLRTPTN